MYQDWLVNNDLMSELVNIYLASIVHSEVEGNSLNEPISCSSVNLIWYTHNSKQLCCILYTLFFSLHFLLSFSKFLPLSHSTHRVSISSDSKYHIRMTSVYLHQFPPLANTAHVWSCSIHGCTHTHTHTHTHMHTHMCMYTHTVTHTHTHTHTHMRMHTHTCAYTHTHAHAHSHTHTHTPQCQNSGHIYQMIQWWAVYPSHANHWLYSCGRWSYGHIPTSKMEQKQL